MSPLFARFDQAKLDDYAGRFVAVMLAVLDFADNGDGDSPEEISLPDAALTKALLTVLANVIADPDSDPSSDEEIAAAMGTFLVDCVREIRAKR